MSFSIKHMYHLLNTGRPNKQLAGENGMFLNFSDIFFSYNFL